MKAIEKMLAASRIFVRDKGIDGFRGEIQMPKWEGSVIVSWGGGWEHVSVSPYKHHITPSWDDMCYIKSMFWNEDECVAQFHPPKSQYVNGMPNCLHLWKPAGHDFEMPPSVLVGVRDGQSMESLLKEMEKLK